MSATAQEHGGPGALSAYAIGVQGLSVWYGSTRALHDLSIHVPHGSVYGLAGPSGAGKSTALRVLATVQPPNRGTVLIDGIDVTADPAAARDRIGYLSDDFGMYGALTAAEYLDFYGAIYRIPPRRRRQIGEELLELVGLSERRDEAVESLPKGMKQKLGLARCLIHDPTILLLDEPASGMDPHSRLDLRDMLQELARFGKTVLISSNMLSDLAAVCSHLGVLRGGELVLEGPGEEILAMVPEVYLRVRLLDPGDADSASRLLTAHPACHRVDASDPTTLLASFDGTEHDRASLLGQLSRSGVRVTEFTQERPTLEDVFLQVAALEASA